MAVTTGHPTENRQSCITGGSGAGHRDGGAASVYDTGMGRPVLLLIVVAASAVVLRAAPRTGSATSQPTTRPGALQRRPDPERVKTLVPRLGSRIWREREEAAAALKRMGPDICDPLGEAYRNERQFEVRVRIKAIASDLFVAKHFPARKGFLGVRLDIVTAARAPRLGRNQAAILVERIIAGTAAERAGLRVGDLIISLNGNPVTHDRNAFTAHVQSLVPGTRVEMEVIRGSQKGKVAAVLGGRPLRLEYDPSVHMEIRRAWQRWWSQYAEASPPAATRPAQ